MEQHQDPKGGDEDRDLDKDLDRDNGRVSNKIEVSDLTRLQIAADGSSIWLTYHPKSSKSMKSC